MLGGLLENKLQTAQWSALRATLEMKTSLLYFRCSEKLSTDTIKDIVFKTFDDKVDNSDVCPFK